jgi:hypothetical protein
MKIKSIALILTFSCLITDKLNAAIASFTITGANGNESFDTPTTASYTDFGNFLGSTVQAYASNLTGQGNHLQQWTLGMAPEVAGNPGELNSNWIGPASGVVGLYNIDSVPSDTASFTENALSFSFNDSPTPNILNNDLYIFIGGLNLAGGSAREAVMRLYTTPSQVPLDMSNIEVTFADYRGAITPHDYSYTLAANNLSANINYGLNQGRNDILIQFRLKAGTSANLFRFFQSTAPDENLWFGMSDSPVILPEPSKVLFLGAGSILLLLRRKRKNCHAV